MEQAMNRRTVLGGVAAMAGMASVGAGRGRIAMVHGQSGDPMKDRRHIRLLKPSLAIIIDRVPQARSRIESAQKQIVGAVAARDAAAASVWMTRHVRDFRRGYEVAGIPLSTEVGQDPDAAATGVS